MGLYESARRAALRTSQKRSLAGMGTQSQRYQKFGWFEYVGKHRPESLGKAGIRVPALKAELGRRRKLPVVRATTSARSNVHGSGPLTQSPLKGGKFKWP